jgi:cytochrome c biogenesis protein CcmG, thiol:disulfide interchange protein DsbE
VFHGIDMVLHFSWRFPEQGMTAAGLGSRDSFGSFRRALLLLAVFSLLGSGCGRRSPSEAADKELCAPNSVETPSEPAPAVSQEEPKAQADDLPLFVANSPFEGDGELPAEAKDDKRLWANSVLWQKAPELIVERWLSEEPRTEGKCVLIEFWATWCPPCRKSISLLNQFHKTFGDELVVTGISDEAEDTVRRFAEPRPEYSLAIDTQHRTKDALGVFGVPHVIILEPGGCVVWEGFPYLKGHELTEEVVRGILQAARKNQN